VSDLPVLGFADRAAFEDWLAAESPASRGAWIRLAKGKAAMLGKAEAIDAALCHGWIDGQIARGAGDSHFLTRFTPRSKRSRWSEKNRARAEELIAAGRMTDSGHAAIESARADGRWDAAYPPPSTAELPADFAAALDAKHGARDFFDTLTGANRYAFLYRLHHVRSPDLRKLRISEFTAMCATGRTFHG
jgi:uncharacterized protein YdeI (YjbR/CyaY-like superfamily)